MGYVISIMSFMWRALRAILTFILSLPGMVVAAIAGLVGFVQGLVYNVGDVLFRMNEFLDMAKDKVSDLVTYASSSSYFGFFYELFALDAFGVALSYFLSIVLLLLFLIVFEFVFQGVVVVIPFLIFKVVGKILQVVSLGFSKPA